MTPIPTSPTAIAEIVTFALTPGTDPGAFLQAASTLDPWLAGQPGFSGRRLSRSDVGTWTDHVLWADIDSAMAAAAALPARPEAAAFLAMIDLGSLAMRHEALAHRQDA